MHVSYEQTNGVPQFTEILLIWRVLGVPSVAISVDVSTMSSKPVHEAMKLKAVKTVASLWIAAHTNLTGCHDTFILDSSSVPTR